MVQIVGRNNLMQNFWLPRNFNQSFNQSARVAVASKPSSQTAYLLEIMQHYPTWVAISGNQWQMEPKMGVNGSEISGKWGVNGSV